jgi:hypothetical protein
MDDQSLICTLTHQFEGLLRPYIQHNPNDEENVTPIFTCPMSQREKPFFQNVSIPSPTEIEPFTRVFIPFICGKMSRKSHTSHSPLGIEVSLPDPEPCTASRGGF